jgi:hypothetical protein
MAKRKIKVPKPAKLPRPLARDLRANYKKLISLSLENRIASLSMAIQWYLQALPYLMQRYKIIANHSVAQQLALATKCRKLGIGNTNLEEKETAFLQAVRIYEKLCSELRPVPVDSFYSIFEARKASLIGKQARMENKYGEAIGLLQRAIGNKLTLNIADAAKAVQYDPHLHSISFNREAARKITERYRKEGLLAAFLEQLDLFAQESALAPDGQGGYQYDPVRHIMAVKDLLKEFLAFAKTSECPNRIVKKAGAARAPRVNGHARVRGEKVAGRYMAGSAIAVVYERLKDEQWHTKDEVFSGLAVDHQSMGPLRHLKWHGNRDKVWKVTVNGDKIQLKHSFPVN